MATVNLILLGRLHQEGSDGWVITLQAKQRRNAYKLYRKPPWKETKWETEE